MMMYRNYLKIALRALLKHRSYSLINILGLAVGMAVALIIGLWVRYEFSYDRFLPGYEKVYQVKRHYVEDGKIQTIDAIAQPLADALKNEISGLEYVVITDWGGNPHSLIAGENKQYSTGTFVGPDFLKLFRYPLLQGDPASALSQPNSIVLTASTALALFGEDDPINQTVRLDNKVDLNVSGVLADLPANASRRFNYLIPFAAQYPIYDYINNSRTDWLANGFKLYVGLAPNASLEQVAAGMENLLAEKSPEMRPYDPKLSLQPMKNWHLYERYENGKVTGGYIEYVRLFSIIGLLVLLIACINFTNLATARSEKRAKEVGVRKAIGSKRKDLIIQFLSESVLLTSLSFGLALLLVHLALRPFNTLLDSDISIPFASPLFWLIMLAYIGFTALLAGSRPAFYLSAFNAVKVLKGSMQGKRSAVWSRKALVLLQFSCSVALIISTFLIYQQINYVKNRPTGYDGNRLVMSRISDDLVQNYEPLRDELLQSGWVSKMTRASCPVTGINFFTIISQWPGKEQGSFPLGIGAVSISDTYFETLGMQLISGRNFKSNWEADTASVILNRAAVERLGLTDPIGQAISWNRDQHATIVGVVENAILESPYTPVLPTLFTSSGWWETAMFRLAPHVNTQEAISAISAIFEKYNPVYPFQYNFADEAYARKFHLEVMIGKLAALFAGLAIFVSCLGLFGLAAYLAEQRQKEIGIRKVLGATVAQIWLLLSREFIFLVLISCLVATPVALHFAGEWLAKYEYRISIQPLVFVLAAGLALAIALLTLSFQAVKAGRQQPVKSLRAE